MKDLRDPDLLGQCVLGLRSLRPEVQWENIVDWDVPNYNANPSCLEKYGRPQDLPPTPF